MVVLRDIIIRSLQSFMLDGVWCPTSRRLFDDDFDFGSALACAGNDMEPIYPI